MKNITFINAGAGSGKTYSLTSELYRFINDGTCRGDQVMLTTFTKRAAEEIRNRAFTKLLENGKTEDAIALQNAWIGTVHSVGYRLMEKFCYLIGFSPEIRELSDEDTDFYFSQAISSIPSVEELNQLAELGEKFQFQTYKGVGISESDPNKWKDHVRTIIGEARRNNITDLGETGLSYVNSLEFPRSVFGVHAEVSLDIAAIRGDLDMVFSFLEDLPDTKNGERKKNGSELKAALGSSKISYPILLDIYDVASDIINKTDDTHQPSLNLLRTLGSIYQSADLFSDIALYIKLVFKIVRDCIKRFDEYKRENGLVDFTDMETRFLELIGKPEVQAELKQSVRLVMVDEFQDSNPVQLAIFLKLSEIVDNSIWVGDPKQAIYGFNGSDPILVSKLLEFFYKESEGHLKLRLLKNSWRSRPGLVNLVNKMFEVSLKDQSYSAMVRREDVLGDGDGLERWKNEKFGNEASVTLSPEETIGLIPVRSDEKDGFTGINGHLPLQHWHFINKIKGTGNKEQFSYYLAQRIKSLLNEGLMVHDKSSGGLRCMRPSDVAVLCRKNDEVKAIAGQLLNNGLEVAAIVDGLPEKAEYRLLINLLNYIADPSNSLSLTEIMLLVKESDQITAESMLEARLEFLAGVPSRTEEDSSAYYHYIQRWGKEHPFIVQLDQFASHSRHLSVPELIEKMFAVLEIRKHISAWGNAEQRLANMQQVLKYAWEYDDYCVKLSIAPSLIGFVVWMTANTDRSNQAASASENAVNVLTYHKAKGLEWPFVILTSLDYQYNDGFMHKDFFRTSVKMDGVLNIQDPLLNRYINFSFWPFGRKEKIIGYEETIKATALYQEAERFKRNEVTRLLYVGMTRARDYIVSTSFKEKESAWMILSCGHGDSWSLKNKTKELVANQFADLFDHGVEVNYQVMKDDRTKFSTEYEGNDYKPGVYFEKVGATTQDQPKYISPSKLVGAHSIRVELVRDFNHRIWTGNLEDEALLGNCLHDILYLWPENPGTEKIAAIISRHNLTGQVNAADILHLIEQIAKWVQELNPTNIYRELPMRNRVGESIMVGTADLVLEFDNELLIVDYKSYPGSYTEVITEGGKHFAGIYIGQLDAYADMLEAALCKKVTRKTILYSVLGKIVELK